MRTMNIKKTIKVPIPYVKIDPIVCDMPELTATFLKFSSSNDGKKLYVTYVVEAKGENNA